jgi:hypothetical protein
VVITAPQSASGHGHQEQTTHKHYETDQHHHILRTCTSHGEQPDSGCHSTYKNGANTNRY